MESNLTPGANDTTHALLTQLIQIGLGNFTAAGSTPVSPAPTWSPPTANIRIQCIAYTSLFCLLAAFGAVLGKHWLGCYKVTDTTAARRMGMNERSADNGILSSSLWNCPQRQYVVFVLFPDGDGIFGISRVSISDVNVDDISESKLQRSYIRRSNSPPGILSSQCTVTLYLQPAHSHGAVFSRYFSAFYSGGVLTWEPEAQSSDHSLNIVATNQSLLKLELPDIPTSSLEAPCIKWLVKTSTDPEVFLVVASLVPHVDWPLDLDVSYMLRHFSDLWALWCIIYQTISSCFAFQGLGKYLAWQKIKSLDYTFPDSFDKEAKDLVRHLFIPDPTQRLGTSSPDSARSYAALRPHPFFTSVS
ncbi:uncharacterized protein F5147DRAFT_816261 [Suillus discolor]|uniref:DUF6535 domain-containing protein n=1 Tax=Suillus discolor TaxID=1912936 RepID=A0A9P7JQ79_9AGAM|nr:uncharacterized protein F5147DRAFT_816261 [Suillus discolor]KAG2097989.1 hypothetical protein F5147DRAFT_816261 [Suillus discolor]